MGELNCTRAESGWSGRICSRGKKRLFFFKKKLGEISSRVKTLEGEFDAEDKNGLWEILSWGRLAKDEIYST